MTEINHDELSRLNTALQEKLLHHMAISGEYPTAIAGLRLFRHDESKHTGSCFGKPMIALIVQGNKYSVMGTKEYQYGENQYVVAGVDLPNTYYIVNSDTKKPFLSIGLDLDRAIIAQLATNIAYASPPELKLNRGAYIDTADAELLEAFVRLITLLDKPEQIALRAPLLIRDIHTLLVMSKNGRELLQVHRPGTSSNKIAQAIQWIRNNYKEQLHIENLATMVYMATSTFHHQFKAITGLSPLQFHKQLRLYEAQRLMAAENEGANGAALAVGYESVTQFNREYKRLFGEPPYRDANRRREYA